MPTRSAATGARKPCPSKSFAASVHGQPRMARQQAHQASTRPKGSASTRRIQSARQAAKEKDDFAILAAVVKAHQQKPVAVPPTSSCEMDSMASLVKIPFSVHVNMMGGKSVEVQAERAELVAHLRRAIAKAVGKPLTHLVLALGTRVLHGMELVGDVVGESECFHITAFLSQDCGPVEEWMDEDHPEGLTDYMPDLYSKMKKLEQKKRVCISPTYMEKQEDITARMRAILVDWLLHVHMKYHLRTVSLFLTVQILDRYLQTKEIGTKWIRGRKRLQLVGVTALLLASKFEDLSPICAISEMVWLCDGAYTNEDISKMEVDMLTTLGFELCTSTASHFLDLYKQANRCDDHHCHAVDYLMQLALLDLDIAGEPPSKSAAAAICLSNQLLHRDVCWPEGMASYTGYSENELQGVSQKMSKLLAEAATSPLGATYRKFSYSNFGSVAAKLV